MKKWLAALSTVVLVVALCSPAVFAAEEVAFKGEIMDNGKLLSEEGEEYTIAEEGKGGELAEMAGKTVSVKGTVVEQEGEKVITVISYTEEKGAGE